MKSLPLILMSVACIYMAACESGPTPEELAVADSLKTELSTLREDIVEAEVKSKTYGGLLQVLSLTRLEILKTSEALLEQRINAIETGAKVDLTIPGTHPDSTRAELLLQEIAQEEEALLKAQVEADLYTGGLVRALKLSTVATHEHTLATLRYQYLVAKYGLAMPTSEVAVDDSAPAETTTSAGLDSLLTTQPLTAWMVDTSTNPLDDSKTVILQNEATEGGTRWGNKPTLVLRCQSNKTNAYINWGDYLGDRPKVTTRLGDQPAETRYWTSSTDDRATFFPGNDVAFIKSLMEVDRLVAQVTPYNESPVTAVFNLAGLTDEIVPLQEACGW